VGAALWADRRRDGRRVRLELLVRGAGRHAVGLGILIALFGGACTSLRMTPPETGGGGTGGDTGGSAGTGGLATGGTTGVGGTTGAGGTGGGAVGGTGGGAVGGTGGGAVGGTGGGVTGRGGSGGGGTGGAIVEPPGLIAFWRFNEASGTTVADSSGNGQALTLSTNNGWTAAGREMAAFAFDGANDVARVVPAAGQPLYDFPTVPLSFSAWVRPGLAAASRPFATAVARTHEDYAFQDFWLGLANGRPACTIHSPTMEGAIASAAAPASAWTHIACTYGLAGVATLYVNGVAAATHTTNQNLGPIPTAILVGASETMVPSQIAEYFPGAIDDVRIYNVTLTAAEIASIAR
jgi:hypothetical protein